MNFFTAINCIDGRTQKPVTDYLKKKYDVDYVDMITEAGPNRILGEQDNSILTESIFERLDLSLDQHKSKGIAVVCHHDCYGCPASREEQEDLTRASIDLLKNVYGGLNIVGLWLDEKFKVHEIH